MVNNSYCVESFKIMSISDLMTRSLHSEFLPGLLVRDQDSMLLNNGTLSVYVLEIKLWLYIHIYRLQRISVLLNIGRIPFNRRYWLFPLRSKWCVLFIRCNALFYSILETDQQAAFWRALFAVKFLFSFFPIILTVYFLKYEYA